AGHEAIAFRIPAQAAQRLQQRTIGFAHPIVIDALTTPHGDVLRGRDLCDKRIDERRLANPRFADDEPDLSHALPCGAPPLPQLGELGVAPDEVWRAVEKRWSRSASLWAIARRLAR